MTRREVVAIIAAIALALGVSTLLYVGALASEAPATAGAQRIARPRVFFDFRNTPPPARAISEIQASIGPLAAIVPFQRGVTDNARDAAGFLLIILVTATTLVVAHDRVVSAYRASLGGWRAQARVFLSGVAVLGLGLSATALAWVVYLGYVATHARGAPFCVPVALQLGLAAFGVIIVVLLAVFAIGFAATAWHLGDALLRPRALARLQAALPAPAIALVGATVLYVLWQLPGIVGGLVLAVVIAYALGAVVTARFSGGGVSA